jgi:hypothetical protein
MLDAQEITGVQNGGGRHADVKCKRMITKRMAHLKVTVTVYLEKTTVSKLIHE